MLDPIVVSSITAAVSVLGNEYAKGIASEAGKATWIRVKGLLGWPADPSIGSLPVETAKKLDASPEIASKLVQLLQTPNIGSAAEVVGNINATGGKVVVINTVNTTTFQI